MNIIEKNNRWTFVKRVGRKILAKCDCGTEKEIYLHHYKDGSSKSCGCLQKEKSSKANKTHGQSNSDLYKVWKGMNTRCYNPKSIDYKNYGGRGIVIWWNNFEEFKDDMEEGYKKPLTIDRIDVNLGYSKENCKWSTRAEQNRNKR